MPIFCSLRVLFRCCAKKFRRRPSAAFRFEVASKQHLHFLPPTIAQEFETQVIIKAEITAPSSVIGASQRASARRNSTVKTALKSRLHCLYVVQEKQCLLQAQSQNYHGVPHRGGEPLPDVVDAELHLGGGTRLLLQEPHRGEEAGVAAPLHTHTLFYALCSYNTYITQRALLGGGGGYLSKSGTV